MRRRRRPERYGAAAPVWTRSTAVQGIDRLPVHHKFGCAPRAPSLSKWGSRCRSMSRSALDPLWMSRAAAASRAREQWGRERRVGAMRHFTTGLVLADTRSDFRDLAWAVVYLSLCMRISHLAQLGPCLRVKRRGAE